MKKDLFAIASEMLGIEEKYLQVKFPDIYYRLRNMELYFKKMFPKHIMSNAEVVAAIVSEYKPVI